MYSITCIIQTRNIFRIKLKKLRLFHSKIKKNSNRLQQLSINNFNTIQLMEIIIKYKLQLILEKNISKYQNSFQFHKFGLHQQINNYRIFRYKKSLGHGLVYEI